ncbi:MAG: Gfo/Idh/MocA family oxidoreductase [Planctomycetota bacterium]
MPQLAIGLVGPGSTRQGLGPYLARFAERAGARIVAVCGRDPGRTEAAAAGLAAELGHEVRACADVHELVGGTAAPLHGLIIASPHEAHGEALDLALDAGLAVLCEKPLLWSAADELIDRAEALVHGFARMGLPLVENCQWPYALPVWQGLFPRFRIDAAQGFRCRLSPVSTGAAQVPDAMPHALSLLQALRPSGGDLLEDLRIEAEDDAHTGTDLRFRWPGDRGSLDCLVELRRVPEPPRPFGFGLDEAWAEREVVLPDYTQSLHADPAVVARYGGPSTASVALEDPLWLLVRAFVDRLRRGERGRSEVAVVQRLRMLVQCRDRLRTG